MIHHRLALACAAVALVAGTARAAPACDRACLDRTMTAYLKALVAHRPGALPLARGARFTENGQELKLGEGLWKSATGLEAYRQQFLDVKDGVAGAHVIVRVEDKPAFLVVRLKLAGRRIREIETQVTYSRADGAIFEPGKLTKTSEAMAYAPTAAERASREEAVRLASYYPRGLQEGSFVTIDAPFAPDAYRLENGAIMAGPDCSRTPDCKTIKGQSIGPGRSGFQTRVAAVDEEAGIVWLRLSWARGQGRRLIVWEAFKVWGGQIHAVEAFMKQAPVEQGSGWD